jgi:hypothetical protein
MPTQPTSIPQTGVSSPRTSWLSALVTLVLFAGSLTGCSGHSVIETEAELTMAEVLYTAVTGRRLDLLTKCEADLAAKEASGAIGAKAGSALKDAISKGKEGKWESAARSLDELIRNHPPFEHK